MFYGGVVGQLQKAGRVSAISATARKLVVIIWNMMVRRVPYINPEGYLFLDQKKLGLGKRIKKQIVKFGFTEDDLGPQNSRNSSVLRCISQNAEEPTKLSKLVIE